MMQVGIDMADLAVLADCPAGDAVKVINRLAAAFGQQRVARRLNIPGTVGRAALQHRGAAVPSPRNAEAGRRLWQDRLLQGGSGPALAAVGRDVDQADLAVARPRETRDLVSSGA